MGGFYHRRERAKNEKSQGGGEQNNVQGSMRDDQQFKQDGNDNHTQQQAQRIAQQHTGDPNRAMEVLKNKTLGQAQTHEYDAHVT